MKPAQPIAVNATTKKCYDAVAKAYDAAATSTDGVAILAAAGWTPAEFWSETDRVISAWKVSDRGCRVAARI